MKIVPYLLIAAGIVLFVFPVAREYINEREQQQLVRELERSIAPADSKPSIDSENARLTELLQSGLEGATEEESERPTIEEPLQTLDDKTIAIIEIDKIDLKLPVLEGATTKNMKVGAAHMTETAQLGEIGNAAVAAHRAHTKGRLFNRLDEIEIGDMIDIRMRDGKVMYRVTEIKIVEPTDLSVLNGNQSDAMLTLITCDPLVNPTHRLIVHAIKSEE
ncbi:class D sortase [Cohnella herbarum]|uniref:Class D sortase n=1 Tax=Cohnella herbarum TaxID=2728023 RepID=A0A7Z2VFP5_9BACL|nr:class D sortase [Cohnella herbarum]QJD82348.1 class D sortase [Cohnella herbarum]